MSQTKSGAFELTTGFENGFENMSFTNGSLERVSKEYERDTDSPGKTYP